MASSTYIIHSLPAPIVVVDNSEAATYVTSTTVVVASKAPVVSTTNTFTQGFFMIPSVAALVFGLAREILKWLP